MCANYYRSDNAAAAHDALFAGWQARLQLGFEQRNDSTLLFRREHLGPLRLQKPLYPEGRQVCHAVVLHPPAGIVGGDALEITVEMRESSHALLTTPGAGKWYRSAGPWAAQKLNCEVGKGGVLEWLPQETIVFNGALADMRTHIALAADARFIGWDVLCLGRRASGERYESGEIRWETRINREGRPLWLERGALAGGSPLLRSPAGLAGFSVSGTMIAAGADIDTGLLVACRDVVPAEQGAGHGITALPDLVVARYLGHSSEAARGWFAGIWRLLRPALIGREAQIPRLWNT